MWDEQIDRIARDLIRRHAPADLRARVEARIDASTEWHPRRIAWAAASVTALAALGLFVAFLLHPRQAPERSPIVAHPSATAVPDALGAQVDGTRADADPGRPAVQVSAVRVGRRDKPAKASVSVGASFSSPLPSLIVEALNVPALLPEEPVITDPIATEPLALDVLEIRPVDIRALDQN